MLLLGVFAGVALVLAGIGLYGVVSYTVSQRTREIGLRLAIGATPADVLKMVLGGGMKLAIIGVVVGLARRAGVDEPDRVVALQRRALRSGQLCGDSVLLLAIAALACYVPARRATRVDPIAALHQQ